MENNQPKTKNRINNLTAEGLTPDNKAMFKPELYVLTFGSYEGIEIVQHTEAYFFDLETLHQKRELMQGAYDWYMIQKVENVIISLTQYDNIFKHYYDDTVARTLDISRPEVITLIDHNIKNQVVMSL